MYQVQVLSQVQVIQVQEGSNQEGSSSSSQATAQFPSSSYQAQGQEDQAGFHVHVQEGGNSQIQEVQGNDRNQ